MFFLTNISQSKTLFSPDCTPDCSVLFIKLCICLPLMGGYLQISRKKKKNLVFRRFRLLVSLPLSFPVLIKLFLKLLTLNFKHISSSSSGGLVCSIKIACPCKLCPFCTLHQCFVQPHLANMLSFSMNLSPCYKHPLVPFSRADRGT